MNDLEITLWCAKAMGYKYPQGIFPDLRCFDPLHDDGQAMKMVKALHLCIQPPQFVKPQRWHVWVDPSGIGVGSHTAVANPSYLNRAICECVARMEASK